jgi:hypothetical protein
MATWKKVAISGSNISQFNNDSDYIIDGQSGVILSGSFTGSFDGVLVNGTTATTQTQGDNSTKVATTAYVDALATAADLNITGSGGTTTDIDLDSQALTFTGNDGLQLSASAQTITATIADGGIANAKLANSTISGKALGTNLDDLTVDNDTLQLNTGTTYNGSAGRTISVKDGGIDTDAIADSLGTLGTNQFTGSFTGSFTGDGSGLTNVDASSLLNSLTDGTGIADFTFNGSSAASVTLDLTQVIATDGENRVLTSDNDGTLTAEPNFTFDGTTLTVTGNEIITGNLTVQGTASFQHNEELQVADRFVLFASGSNTAGDGGIVVQQGTQNIGELFAFDSGTTRWGLTGSFDSSNTSYTPDAFMASVVEGTDNDPNNAPARYDKKGNIFVGTTEGEIWIYG